MSFFLTLPEFSAPGVTHGFFGRRGGKSTGPYETLNIGQAPGDPFVMDNRARVAAAMGGALDHLMTVYQTHTDACVYVDRVVPMPNRPQADAMVTDVPGLILGIITADCVPILIHGQKADGAPVIAAIHAGWRGTLRGIVENTIVALKEHGALNTTLKAAIGPCIRQKSYEVSRGFERPFLDRAPGDARFFIWSGEKLLFDLPGYAAARLSQAGIDHVVDCGIDTYTDPDYFSYRQATHLRQVDNGRQISCVVIG